MTNKIYKFTIMVAITLLGQYKGIFLILYRIVENIPTMEVSSIKLYIVKYLIDFLDSVLDG